VVIETQLQYGNSWRSGSGGRSLVTEEEGRRERDGRPAVVRARSDPQ
jgi:hypothetical protein